MKITRVTSYLIQPAPHPHGWKIGKNLLFVRVETDAGLTGWGECFALKDRELAIAHNVKSLSPSLCGRTLPSVRAFTQWACTTFAEGRPALELFAAVSGIEQALWDILGKSVNTPVSTLLGGPLRDRIRVYANGWTAGATTAEEMARRAAAVVQMGFTAIKLYPFQNEEGAEAVARNVRTVRQAIGPAIDLLIDVWRRPEPCKVVQVAHLIQDCHVFWYEEPVPSENLDVLAEVRRRVGLPVVTGECLYTKSAFREVLEKRAADILNPDVASCGGILALTEIAAMAEPYFVQVSPHNYNSTAVGLAATLQAAALLPNFVLTEYFINFQPQGDALLVKPFQVENGFIQLPTTPGLGIEVNEEVLQRNAREL